MSIVSYIAGSKNVKIGDVDATYASVASTCPSTCSLKDKGCYAQQGNVGIYANRLEKTSAIVAATAEAKAIDASYRGGSVPERNVRIHVSGDSKTIVGTKRIAAAVKRWKARGGKAAWTYTHAHSRVHRKHWGSVSVLASLDNISQIAAARQQGYAPAIIVNKFDGAKAFMLEGVKFIPCPAQTKDNVTCTSCKLCWDSDRLYKSNMGIAFAAHGVQKRNLPVIK